jgi:hypothetical protein
MVRIFVRHSVADYGEWRRVYDEFDEERRSLGVTAHAAYQALDDPNDITVWHDFETREAAVAFASSERLRQVIAEAGVQGEPSVWLVTEAE